ncbi:hypothetical protein B0J13DRAFT_556332 [Dactylonectria estremocensis]|uniref:Uncharacterized protein n=1 Tax=Dactylonectria estremocensis TaxID=1079267 RepID=A0A9P9EN73_9HYPO|nr:hypothetical protein B0J13DRAFT_556332 [Dactylonectria estremocensis]
MLTVTSLTRARSALLMARMGSRAVPSFARAAPKRCHHGSWHLALLPQVWTLSETTRASIFRLRLFFNDLQGSRAPSMINPHLPGRLTPTRGQAPRVNSELGAL